jgi:hypothetical protein
MPIIVIACNSARSRPRQAFICLSESTVYKWLPTSEMLKDEKKVAGARGRLPHCPMDTTG